MRGDPRGVFYDISDTEDEAANRTARANVMRAIQQKIRAEGWTEAEAAKALRVTRPRVADLLDGKMSRFSLDVLVGMLPALGLELVVRQEID